MQIRRLKLSGFKSFVEPAELRIEPGLTGVVGPNGCGKSNLLEAIRWVMGEGSAKSLRGGGMDDVIFAGTATRPARDFAEVSLLVDGVGTEGNESEVTRRIERGTGSAYRRDGRDVRAKDVSLLFADSATGAHSPALVSQGRIGSIIAAKPVERRQMLEEAAGISGLHARRKDAEQKLRATEANLVRVDELLSDQQARIGQLRRQARAAERYRQVSERIRVAEGRLLYAKWAEADHAAKAAETDAQRAIAEVEALQNAMSRAEVAQAAAARLLTERREATQTARDAGRTLAHELATARARHDTVTRRLAELERFAASLQAEKAREESLREDAADAIAALEQERAAIEMRLSDAEAQAGRMAADLTAAEARSRGTEASLAELLAQDAATRAERRIAEAAVNAAQTQMARFDAEAARLAEQLAGLGDGDDLRAAVAEAGQRAGAAESAGTVAEQALAVADAGRAQALLLRDAREQDLAEARAALAGVEAELAVLRRSLEGASAKALTDLRATAGYERALAAALGDDLEAVIGLGAARRWEGSEIASDDPLLAVGLDRLLDHVTAPAELHRRLAQIGVVEADAGQALAVGQRLVTRDGVVRRWDGFVSSGSGAAAAERLIRVNRLAEVEQRHPTLRESVESGGKAREQASAAVEKHRLAAEDARRAIAQAERDAREARRAADAAAAGLDRLLAQRTAVADRQHDLTALAAEAEQVLAAAEATVAALPQVATLTDEIQSARDLAMQASRVVADTRASAATLARATGSARERLATAAREAGEWRRRSSAAEARVVETVERSRLLCAEQEALAGQPATLTAEVADLERQASASEAATSAAAGAEREAEEALAGVATALREAAETFADARERRAGAVARVEGHELRRREYAGICGEKFECPPPLLPGKLGFLADEVDAATQESAALDRLHADRERIGPVNLVAEQELAELESSLATGSAERDELQEAINRLRGSIGSLNREGRTRLLDAFHKVDAHFRSLFTTLFDGGQAHLELVESEDPLEAGLEILAQPPGKRLSALTLLSGGEQALTAVALIFALFLTNPAPICVLDEVDAPLDDANVERFCDLLERMSDETETRYLIVTHNAVTMSRMHRLYGVTMIEKGISRLVSVDLERAEHLLAAE